MAKVDPPKIELVWRNVIGFIVYHLLAVVGLYNLSCVVTWKTFTFVWTTIFMSILGTSAGAHRLWSHRAYKVRLPLSVFLAFCQTISFQNSIHEWARDHRVHHKYTDTDADPHNASRGFFFSHIGWLMVRKHRDVITKGQTIDMSDLERDSVVMFQKRYYVPLALTISIVLPTLIPWYWWGEMFHVAFTTTICRYVLTLHGTWSVNSVAHIWGMRPYDKNIKASENSFVNVLTGGDGWHNYHHVFPMDYRSAELGGTMRWNSNTLFINLMATLGLAYDLKTVSGELVEKRARRTGDGSRVVAKYS